MGFSSGLRKAVFAGAATLALVALMPGSAQAAIGRFSYVTAAGQLLHVDRPASGTCLQLQDGAVRFENGTSDTAFLFSDSSCSGGYEVEQVDLIWKAPAGVQALSVRFEKTA
ncbi:hypothetical protein OHA40_17130 [Nocardia sp. NBC_00508]|uniref:hypothetical protein n=1 Tax=Nocardia sp. NBC_00508 TaxID=2975992 RepID=UPI002E80BC3A|nr:hypothetical protein [Nocardia sp. NBC_00508]WUD63518.1 hypothetical protein OHA40_17130 [Nocardia sp. NBC_00508]